jgi:hypothetical protein
MVDYVIYTFGGGEALVDILKALDQVQNFALSKWGELITTADRIDKLVARERG